MDLYFLVHLCFFQTLGRIIDYITEKSLYLEKGPAIILKGDKNFFLLIILKGPSYKEVKYDKIAFYN